MVFVANDAGADVSSAMPATVPLWWRGPGGWFHLLVGVAVLAWLWSWSVPGTHFLVLMASSLALLVGAVLWGIHLVAFVVVRRRGRPTSGAPRFLLAPVVGTVALALVAAGVPLDARWSLSRSAFEDVVDDALEDDDHRSTDERRIGLYTVDDVYSQGEVVIFRVPAGGFVDPVGFAYLPEGPRPEVGDVGLNQPQFHHVDGPWYTFTARF